MARRASVITPISFINSALYSSRRTHINSLFLSKLQFETFKNITASVLLTLRKTRKLLFRLKIWTLLSSSTITMRIIMHRIIRIVLWRICSCACLLFLRNKAEIPRNSSVIVIYRRSPWLRGKCLAAEIPAKSHVFFYSCAKYEPQASWMRAQPWQVL